LKQQGAKIEQQIRVAIIVIYDMCIVMWNFTIRDGKIVQQAEGELDNPSSIVTTHYDTNIVQRFIYFHN
jgi:hypothetical protein